MNFLENHCQKHILSPVWHDQHPETHSLVPWLIPLRIGALSGDDLSLLPVYNESAFVKILTITYWEVFYYY